MTKAEYVADFIEDWHIGGETAIQALKDVIQGIEMAIMELEAVNVDPSDLQELQQEFRNRIGWYEND